MFSQQKKLAMVIQPPLLGQWHLWPAVTQSPVHYSNLRLPARALNVVTLLCAYHGRLQTSSSLILCHWATFSVAQSVQNLTGGEKQRAPFSRLWSRAVTSAFKHVLMWIPPYDLCTFMARASKNRPAEVLARHRHDIRRGCWLGTWIREEARDYSEMGNEEGD